MKTRLTRRRFLEAAGVSAVALSAGGLGGPPRRADGPNVVVIVLDSVRPDHLYGDRARTPNMDALVREGLAFRGTFPEALPTGPARNTILSGRRQFPFRDWEPRDDLSPAPGWEPLEDVGSTFTSALRRAGWWTVCATDNPFLGFSESYEPLRRSFDQFMPRGGQVKGRSDGVSDEEVRRWLPPPLVDELHFARVRDYLANGRYSDDESQSFAARVFRDASGALSTAALRQPFAMVIDSFEPHEPWTPPRKYVDMYGDPDYAGPEPAKPFYEFVESYMSDAEAETLLPRMRALYAAELTMTDEWLGRFLGHLTDFGLYDETVFVLVSDHGFLLGEYGYTGKSSELLHPELIEVPLAIVDPGRRRAGEESRYFASTHDIGPTVLSLAGVPIPEEMDGTDLSVLFAGGPLPPRRYAWGGYKNSFFVRDERWALASSNREGGYVRLFDLSSDPAEVLNRASVEPEKVRELVGVVEREIGGRPPYYPEE